VVRIEPHLRQALKATALGDTTYLVTDLGKAFTIAGFGNKMRDWCNAAGLPHCSAHGLRKASAVAFAESGASAPEMCAVFGWSKLETAEIYIREAQKRVMAENAYTRLDEYRARKSVSVLKAETGDETNRGKNRE
jgi:site-specific recombinase XerD